MFEGAALRYWRAALILAILLALLLAASLAVLFGRGIGIWGINHPVGWGLAIVNFVWWIGIAHAGTLISAILLLLRQEWRLPVHRFAEAMTLVAIGCAALFPLIHLGRPWLAYWLLPYPSTAGVWPQFRSPLVWDVFAIVTYGFVSLAFCYFGLLPDLAVLRDRARSRPARVLWCLLAMGWCGSSRQWAAHRTACLLLAGLATPLVISVHSIVSFDFAVSIIPGWHSTIFPPYFVAGALFSGLAVLLALLVPIRTVCRLEPIITERHLENMAKILLAAGLFVAYGYATEIFFAWYGGSRYEQYAIVNRLAGPYAPLSWALLAANIGAVQLFWIPKLRRRPAVLFAVALAVAGGMWLERFVIVVTSLHRDYLPAAWGMYRPTVWDWTALAGSAGLFLLPLLLLARWLPLIPVAAASPAVEPRSVAVPRGAPDPSGCPPYAVLGEFTTAQELVEAARRARQEGYGRLEGYSNVPVSGLREALGGRASRLSWMAFAAGALGCLAGLLLQYWTAAIAMPLGAGGKPPATWPAFIPITFECAILAAALATVAGLFHFSGLPAPYHPVFHWPRVSFAGGDRFFLSIESADPKFDRGMTPALLRHVGAREVVEVEA